ncbi:uncharacterized protein [Eurosta solidaginis]|uniref:uncharacterized protein n=1 Tax=Eurosta solidaginis TaxID=178769 RepID=UPI0035310DA7
MRGFIILCYSAIAIAMPQGYNYNPTSTGYGAVGLASPGQASSQFSVFGQSPNAGGAFLQASNAAAGYGSGPQQHPAIVTKRFFIHTAPEDAEEAQAVKHITVGVPRKNYNVVFIKSAKGTQKKSTIKITPAINEEKTVIYVLNKKSGSTEIDTQVLEQPAVITKPEVYFIKYKTAEEARHAQKKIQAQYDSLGGNTQISDEGVGQVSSVIGSLNGGGAGVGGAIGEGAVNGGYLPPPNYN